MTKLELTDQRFGRLIAIKPTDKRMHRQIVWECLCDCGVTVYVKAIVLTTGGTKSCGCLKREKARINAKKGTEYSKLKKGIANFNRVLANYTRQAENRNHDFCLTRDEFFKITQQNCFFCGAKPYSIKFHENSNGKFIYNGIDRVDNSKGYTLENCVSCCKGCNQQKSDMPIDKMIKSLEFLGYKVQCL